MIFFFDKHLIFVNNFIMSKNYIYTIHMFNL